MRVRETEKRKRRQEKRERGCVKNKGCGHKETTKTNQKSYVCAECGQCDGQQRDMQTKRQEKERMNEESKQRVRRCK